MANTNILRIVIVAAAAVVASLLVAANQARSGAAIVSMDRKRFLRPFMSQAVLVHRSVPVLVACLLSPFACLGQPYGGGNVALTAEHAEESSLEDLLLEELHSFVGEGWEQEDDITLLTLRHSATRS
jgi:hypothetical protein